MTTETHYVVRNEDGDHLSTSFGGDYRWYPGAPQFAQYYSRLEAEALVAVHGGTVQRVTVTTEDVGLRWVDHQRGCPGPCRHWKLMDGDEFVGTVNTDAEGDKWYLSAGMAGTHHAGPFDTIEEAKTAGEAAVRETWT